MSKILFIDVDGTLVNYENILPASAKLAIQKARKNGHRVYICTGRSRAEVYASIWDIGLDGMIGGNGSYIEDHRHVVLNRLITEKQCIHIVDWLHSRGLEFYLESANGLFASEGFEKRGTPVIQEYSRRKGKAEAQQMSVKEVFPDMIYHASLYRNDVTKVSFILNSYQDHLDSVKEFRDLKCSTWGGKGEIALFGDIGVKDVAKAWAVKKLLEYIGGSIEDTIAFGDAKVDIPMLACCQIGVAMGSGGKEIKAMADLVTDSVDDDGLYKAFVKLGLIERDASSIRI